MANRLNVIKGARAPLEVAQVSIPGGYTLPDGRVIDLEMLIPDGGLGYGDAKSAAALAGDVVAGKSTDSSAGSRAYESALEQFEIGKQYYVDFTPAE